MKNIINLSLAILNRLEISNALIPYAAVVRDSVTHRNDIKFGVLRTIDRRRLDELMPRTSYPPYSEQLSSPFLPWNHVLSRTYVNYSSPTLKIDLNKIIANKPNFLKPYKK